MSKDSKYAGTTQSLSVENRSYDSVIYQPTKPVLDSELNFMSDLSSCRSQDFIRSKVPSGWLDADFEIGEDDLSNMFGINTTNIPNTFYVNSRKATPSLAVVNGWVLQVGGCYINDDKKLKITLPEAPSLGTRDDLVFLEVWKRLIKSDPVPDGKPSSTQIYKFGNVNYGGTNLNEEMQNPTVGFETTRRIQIQYRLRIVSGVDFTTHPEGISDFNTVRAQGGAASPLVAYTFTNGHASWDDAGLYVAGDGSDLARTQLATVDGYVYAIPLFRVHRRNKADFSLINQNGAKYSIAGLFPSDRPDGLFYDQIALCDIEDLRHAVSFNGFNIQEILESNRDMLFSGRLNTTLTESYLDSSVAKTNIGFFVNGFSLTSIPGVQNISAPNDQQRYFSDVPALRNSSEKRTINNKTVGSLGTNWVSSDQIKVDIKSPSPTGTTITTTPPLVYANLVTGAPLPAPQTVITPIVGTWSGLGTTSATFTLGVNAGLTDEPLYVSFEISYPQKGFKLTKPITEILKVHEVSNNLNWSWVSVTDPSGQRNKIIPPRVVNTYADYAYDYRLGTKEGVGTLYSYHMAGNGTQTYVIPGNILGIQDLLYVYAAYNIGSSAYMSVTASRDPLTSNISITLPVSFSASQTIRFDLVLKTDILEYDKRTQSITNLGNVRFYELNGNGSDRVVLENTTTADPNDIIVGGGRQGMFNGSTFAEYCYIDNFLQPCTVAIVPNTNLVEIQFTGVVSASNKITVAILSYRKLKTTESLNIYYDYFEYKGITNKPNFGTSVDSFIRSKVLYHDDNLIVTTNGTGGVNTDDLLPKQFEPLIPKLPIINSISDGDFTSTVHTKRSIKGGSYTSTAHNAPYTSGFENYMTKEGVTQTRGTNVGGRATTVADQGENGLHKLVISSLVEQVIEDGSNNFIQGELGLKIETSYLNNTNNNKITNSDSGDSNNSFDMFKIVGRPLLKLK